MQKLVASALLSLAVSLPAGGQASVRPAVDSLHAAMVAAFKSAPSSTATFYTDDAAITGGGMRVVGREAVNGYWSQGMDGATWQLEVLDVGGDSRSPWVHGKSTLTREGRASVTEYVGLLQRGTDQQLRFRVDAYTMWPATPPADPAADERAIRGLDSLWARMYATHDTASALQLYGPQLAFVSANGRSKTLAEELADVRPAAGLTMDYFRTTPATVRTFGRMALVSGKADWRFTMNGSPREVHRKYTAIYSRGGPLGWRIVAIRME